MIKILKKVIANVVANVVKNAKNPDHLHLTGRNENDSLWKRLVVSHTTKLNTGLHYDPTIIALNTYPREMKTSQSPKNLNKNVYSSFYSS